MNTYIKTGQSNFFRLCSYLLLILFCLPLFTSCEGNKTIVNELDEKDANEILVFLSTRGIDAEKVKSTAGGAGGGAKVTLWDISVKTSEASEAMLLLNQQGLPRRRSQNILSLFSTGGLVPSDLQEKIKYRAALGEQLASTIRKYEGILDADVQVSFPEEDPLNPGKMKGKITASVWVKHSGILDDPNSHLVTKIKRFVASSITGLDPDDVTVIGERTRLGENVGGTSSSMEEEKQYVNIWSIVLAKESVTRFRMIFFTFTVVLLLLLLSLVWLLWKVHPILNKYGGIKSLFSIKHISLETPVEENPTEDVAKAENADKAKTDKGLVDKDIDET